MRSLCLLFLLPSIPAFCSLTFEPNRGQTDPRVQFLARTATGAVFITNEEIILNQANKPVRISFTGSNPASPWQAQNPTGHTTTYFLGRDQSKWIRELLQSFEKSPAQICIPLLNPA